MDFAGAETQEDTNKAGWRVFEFDDEPQEKNAVKMRAKKGDGEEDVLFVQFPKSPNVNGNGK